MIIKRIKIKNIRSYKEAEIIFPEGSTLLMGDIGSGKTSILLAIEFALFGLQPSQKGNSILRNNEVEANVVLELVINENNIIIERGLKKSGKSVSQTDCSINVNGENFTGSVTEIKNRILSLLNYPAEFAKKTNDLCKFTVYTPQEEMKQIILESDDTRLNTLRHVFGIDKYKRIEENLEILTSRLRQEIRLRELELGNIEHKKQAINQKFIQIEQEKRIILGIEEELKVVEKTKEEKQKEIESINQKIAEKNKLDNEKEKSELTLDNKKNSIYEYEKEISIIREQLKAKASIKFKEEEIDLIKTHIISQEKILREVNEGYIKLLSICQNNDSKMNELKKLIEKISALEKCPTCLQVVSEEYKKNIVIKAKQEYDLINIQSLNEKKEKDELNLKLENTKRLIDNLKNSLSDMQILKIRLEALNEKEKRLGVLEKQRNSYLLDIDLIRKHIAQLEETMKDYEVYESEFKKKNQELNEILNKERSIMIRKAEANRTIQMIEILIKEIETEIQRIEEITRKLNYFKELEFWLNNKFLELVLYTEKNVMLKLREEFSSLLANWFSILVSDTLSVRLNENFTPMIQQNDYELDYSYLSGGERTAVALAYRLALNQVINSLLSSISTRDLVILDEPTDGFSESQLDKMRDIFSQLKVKQLIIVSHEQKIESFVDNIIRFKKVNGITEIEK